jgi:hypothetical protein
MSIATYAELKSAIATWLDRSDLTSQIPDFITLFEAHAVRELGVEESEATDTLSPTSGSVALPSDFLSAKSVRWMGSEPRNLNYLNPAALSGMYADDVDGTPIHYTIKAGNIIVRPSSDEDLELFYNAKAAAVSGTLNWLFTNHVDAYLSGSLVEAKLFAEDPAGAAMWAVKRDQVLNSIKKLNFMRRGPMQIIPAGPTP